MSSGASFSQAESAEGVTIRPEGRWTLASVAELNAAIRQLKPRGPKVAVDMDGLESLDTAGAVVLYHAMRRWRKAGLTCQVVGGRQNHLDLLRLVTENERDLAPPPPGRPAAIVMLERVGAATMAALDEARTFTAFIGLTIERAILAAAAPWKFRWTAMVYHMEQTGLNALPIVGLVSFLIGVVMAYQGAVQLRSFGAQIYTVDLLAVSILRELGVLLTAILVAGRSGSAFTAEIGAMKFREEIDAMRVLGINPVDALVLPRLVALLLTLPVLAFFANIMGLLGGALLCWATLDISPQVFLDRLSVTNPWHYYTGLIKAPCFAAVVALVGCHEGFQVSGRAESVGRMTTKSVVESIFLVIIIDAGFSIFFNVLGV
jgi:phospholipid/cholesterol/gamma-HCH transport system permease protein